MSTSLKKQENLKRQISEILSDDELAELDPERLIGGLVRAGRKSPENRIFRFETGSILNFPSQANLPNIQGPML
jgi:hypothetical protein